MSTRKRLLRLGFGLALLTLLAWMLDPNQVLASLAGVRTDYLFAAAGLVIIAALIGAVSIHLLFEPEDKLSFRVFLPLFWLSWAIGLVFPGQVGDVASLSALLKRRGIDLSRAVARSVTDKLISFSLMLTFACAALITLPGVSWSAGRWWLVALPLAIIYALYAERKRLLDGLSQRFPRAFHFLIRTADETRSITCQRTGSIILNALLTVLKIVLTGSSYWFIFAALGYSDIGLWSVVSMAAASSLVAYLPLSLNGIGTVELAGVALFGTMGIPATAVFSGYLILRAIVFVIAWGPAGLLLLSTEKQTG